MTIETELNSEEQKYFETEGVEDVEQKQQEDQAKPEEAAVEQEDKQHKEKFVPHGAFHEERQKRKEVEKSLEQERINRAKLEERLNILAETVRQRQEQSKPAIPSFEDDPANHLRMRAQQEQERVAKLEKELARRDQQARAQEQDKGFITAYQAKAMEFAQKTPDFKEAYNHALKARIEDYKVMGHTEEEALKFTLNDERAIATNAMQRGLNPAEVLYNLAKRQGYAMKQQAQDLSTVSKGMQASKSIGQMSGRTGASKLSLDAIASMSDSEFAEATKGQNWEKLWA